MPLPNRPARLLVDLLFPPRCLFCDAIVEIGGQCNVCETAAVRIPPAQRKNFLFGERVFRNLDATVSSYRYEPPASDAVARMKFSARPDLAVKMAEILSADLKPHLEHERTQYIVMGVPSYRGKSAHAATIAKGVAKQLGLAYSKDALIKQKATQKQHELDAQRRARNLAGAFCVKRPAVVAGKTVIVCDDVITSGNTLEECAKTLKAGGARAVIGAGFTATV